MRTGGFPPELSRMVKQEDQEIKPHQEEMEIVNLGIGEEKKEGEKERGGSTKLKEKRERS